MYDNPLTQVRLLIADTTMPYLLDNDQILGYLAINTRDGEQSVRRAAADALDAIASSETLVSKVIQTQDLRTDGTKVAADLRAHADRLRSVADVDDARDIFGVTDTGADPCVPEHTLPYVEWDGGYPQVWGL